MAMHDVRAGKPYLNPGISEKVIDGSLEGKEGSLMKKLDLHNAAALTVYALCSQRVGTEFTLVGEKDPNFLSFYCVFLIGVSTFYEFSNYCHFKLCAIWRNLNESI